MNDDEKKPLYLPPQAEFDALVRETGSIAETLTRPGLYQPVAAPEVWGPAEVGGPDEVDFLRAKVRELTEERDFWEKKFVDLEINRASCCWEMEKALRAVKATDDHADPEVRAIVRKALGYVDGL